MVTWVGGGAVEATERSSQIWIRDGGGVTEKRRCLWILTLAFLCDLTSLSSLTWEKPCDPHRICCKLVEVGKGAKGLGEGWRMDLYRLLRPLCGLAVAQAG